MVGRPIRCAVLFALVACAAIAAACAQNPEELFHRANEAYEQGRFEEAADGYRALLRYRLQDPRLEYNLGNAEFRLGRLGHAILHYERAHQLDPADPEIEANLELARSLTYDRIPPLGHASLAGWVTDLQDRLGPDLQAWIVLGIVWAICAIVAWCSARPGGWSGAAGWGIAGLLLIAALATGSWYATFHRLEGSPRAVIVDEVVEVLAGPGENNAVLATLHEGLTVEVRAVRQEWIQVSVPGRLSGWVSRQALELV